MIVKGYQRDKNWYIVIEKFRQESNHRRQKAILLYCLAAVFMVLIWVIRARLGRNFEIALSIGHFTAFACGHWSWLSAHGQLQSAYEKFCGLRLIPESHQLRKRNPKVKIWIPKREVFRRTSNLVALENRFLGYLSKDFRELEHEKKLQRWAEVNVAAREEFVAMLEHFGLRADIVDQFAQNWDRLSPNPQYRSTYANKVHHALGTKLLQMQAKRKSTEPKIESVAAVDAEEIAFQQLESAAAGCTKHDAKEAFLLGQQANNRTRQVRFFEQALRLQNFEEKDPIANMKIAEEEQAAPNEVRTLDLLQHLSEAFSISTPSGVDAEMAKHIVIVLAKPGNRFRVFHTEARLRKNVRNRYSNALEKNFDPKLFNAALSWLMRIGVVHTEPAKKETTYTLPRNTLEVHSEQARQIIRSAMSLKDELKRGKDL